MNLYLRLFKTLLLAIFARKRLDTFSSSSIFFRCWPNDLDANLHMNNGRYLTLMDLGRLDLTFRSDLWRLLLRKRLNPVAGGVLIRFRRPIGPFERFEVRSRFMGWDSKWFFMEQQLFCADGRVSSIAMVRAVFLRGGKAVPPDEVVRALGGPETSPPLPECITEWLDADLRLGQALGKGNQE